MPIPEQARTLAALFSALPQVEAVALGGSQMGDLRDASSDIDLYVYTRADIPVPVRQSIMEQSGGASRADLGLTFWGQGDEWFDAASGIEVDSVYFDAAWMQGQLRRVLVEHQASLGYSTCFWHTVRQSQILHDPREWFAALQAQSRQEYPEALRRNIIALNHPVLRDIIPSYTNQLEKAVKRGDLVSINHRLAGLFASYFDVLFAANRVLHPGEKRMVCFALNHCARLPPDMKEDVEAVLNAAVLPTDPLLAHVHRMLDRLDALL
jgi:hypothetical protein